MAALILLSCAEFMGVGTYSVLDSIVTGFITLTLCCFYPALSSRGLKQAGWLALAGAFAGGAFLIKGFIAFAVPVVVIIPYLLPCFPAFALLLAVALAESEEQERTVRSINIAIYGFGALIALLWLALPFVVVLNAMGRLPELDAHVGLKFFGIFTGLSLALVVLFIGRCSAVPLRKVWMLAAASATLFITGISCAPTEISPALGIQGLLESKANYVKPSTILVGDPKTTHAMCYVYKRDDIYLFSRMGEFDYGLSSPEAKQRFIDSYSLGDFILQRGANRVVVCIKSRPDDTIKAQLPKPSYQHQWLKIWFAVYEPQRADLMPPPNLTLFNAVDLRGRNFRRRRCAPLRLDYHWP
jgi:4-amino-4-deoxy-L-arabinose transferase-like glycosyltransferase